MLRWRVLECSAYSFTAMARDRMGVLDYWKGGGLVVRIGNKDEV